MMSVKMREKITKTFGQTLFNEKNKIPIHDVVIASMVMGAQNQTSLFLVDDYEGLVVKLLTPTFRIQK